MKKLIIGLSLYLFIFVIGCATINKDWEVAKKSNNIENYEKFIKKYTGTALADSALKKMQFLYAESVQAAVKDSLPYAKLEVDLEKLYSNNSEFIIFEHILENHSADDPDPLVRGDYNTHEKLENLVKERSAKIIKAVLTKAKMPYESILSIEMRHGVRLLDPETKKKISDSVMTLFKVNISKETIKKEDWTSIDFKMIMKLWTLKENIIPELIITPAE